MNEKNHYEVLDVPPGADYGQIRKAYMRLSNEYALDRRNFPGAGLYAERANTAYRVLSDYESRRAYNAEIGLPEPPRPVQRGEDEWWANVVPGNWYVYAFVFVGTIALISFALSHR